MRRGGRIRWDKAHCPRAKPPPDPKLLERAKGNLRRLFAPNPLPFDESLMTDDAREQFEESKNE